MMFSSDWPFEDDRNVWVFTTKAIIQDNKPILYVAHDEDDGSWQFHDGSDVLEEDAVIVGLEEIVQIDETLKSLSACLWDGVHGEKIRTRLGKDRKWKNRYLLMSPY